MTSTNTSFPTQTNSSTALSAYPLPNQIKKLFTQLLQIQDFISNISYYTKIAFEAITSPPTTQSEQQKQCPTAYLLVVAHYYSNNIPLKLIANELPQENRADFLKAVKMLEKKKASLERQGYITSIINNTEGKLTDVKWSMAVQNGMEVWDVLIYTTKDSLKPTCHLRLNYEELSLLAFKVTQLVGHLKAIVNDIV